MNAVDTNVYVYALDAGVASWPVENVAPGDRIRPGGLTQRRQGAKHEESLGDFAPLREISPRRPVRRELARGSRLAGNRLTCQPNA